METYFSPNMKFESVSDIVPQTTWVTVKCDKFIPLKIKHVAKTGHRWNTETNLLQLPVILPACNDFILCSIPREKQVG